MTRITTNILRIDGMNGIYLYFVNKHRSSWPLLRLSYFLLPISMFINTSCTSFPFTDNWLVFYAAFYFTSQHNHSENLHYLSFHDFTSCKL